MDYGSQSGLSLAKLPHTAAYDLGATGILVGSQCMGRILRMVQAMHLFLLVFQGYSDTELARVCRSDMGRQGQGYCILSYLEALADFQTALGLRIIVTSRGI